MNFKTIVNRFFASKYLAFAITLVIFVLVTMPNDEIPVQDFPLTDKQVHFIMFTTWAFCWQGAFGKYLQTILTGLFYGILIEFWQGALPESFHRSFDWYDTIADGLGVLTGVGLWKIKSLLKL